ncbi:hypothetical protein H4R19_001827 [Coemansia spiralis]|nr:hypothetical protein H4R19_001827 [Coemansia spiralis]
MLPPAVPHTTPCASASPDQTPFPPSTSPTVASFDPSDHDLNHLDSAEMQAASPLLLPRGLLALPLDTGLFDAPPSPPGKDDAIPSPADMATPFVTAAAAPAHTDDSVVPAALADSAHYAQTTATAATTATGAEQLHADMCALAAAPARPSSPAHGDVAGVAALDLEADSGFGFSFHELMDAELMSVNELETLWTTSNPVSDAAARYAALEPIPEAASEDAGDDDTCHEATASETSTAGVGRDDAGSTAYTATHDAEDCTSDEMPTQLTQKLLALSERPASAAGALEGTGCRTPKQQASPAKAATAAVSPTRRPEPHRTTPALAAGDGTAAVQPEHGDGPAALDSLEPTRMLVGSADEHEGVASAGPSSKVILPDPFADIPATAMVAMKLPVSPRIVLTIVETVPVYMTVITTTEPAADSPGKWIVRRHRLLRLVENGYVNASSLLLAGGVASEQERSIVLSLEVGRFKWRRPQSKLYGTWIPLPRARALAATCSLNHRLGPFLNDNLEAYFPAPLPTSFIRHLIMPFFSDQPAALLAADASAPPAAPATTAALSAAETAREAGLGIEFQHLVNSTVAGRSHQQAQSISRTSTFGSAARGMPSPSIIQSLAARGGPLGLAGAAKAIFGTDGRHLHSLLQLLSAESPMMGASLGAEPHRARTPGHEAPAASEADAESSAATPSNCVETPPTPLTAATAAAVLTVADELARSAIGDADKATGPIPTPPLSAVEKPGNKPGAVAGGKPHGRDSGAAHSPAVPSPVAGLRPGAMTTRSRRVSSAGRPPAAAAAALAKAARESSTGVDAQELSAAISSTLGGPVPAAAPLDDAMDCDVGGGNSSSAQRDSQDHSDDLDMSMVLPSSDNDVDMISRSTPPSPPMPPVTPPRFRRLSTAPLRISRSASVSSMAIDSAGDGAAGSSSSSHGDSDGDADSGGAEGSDAHTKPQQHCASGTFNARLLQTMEAYGFTGTAKTNMLLRLRAAAAAKSTGRQQAVAPYLLYRNGAGSSALGGVGSKRLKSAVDGDDSSGAQGSVRKRARVVRIPRAKPLPRQGAAAAVPKGRTKNNKLSTPADASAVLRLASAIYNHTLNMATLAQAQRQADSAHAASTAAAAPRPTAAPPPAVERRSPAPGSAGVSVRPPARAPTPMQRPPLRTPTQPGHGRPMLPPRPPPQPPPNTPPRPAMRPASPGQPVRPGARPPMPVGGSPLRTPPPPHPPKAEAPAPRPPPSVVTRHQRQQQQQQQQQAGPSASGN